MKCSECRKNDPEQIADEDGMYKRTGRMICNDKINPLFQFIIEADEYCHGFGCEYGEKKEPLVNPNIGQCINFRAADWGEQLKPTSIDPLTDHSQRLTRIEAALKAERKYFEEIRFKGLLDKGMFPFVDKLREIK
jgi:hypothetical protein